MNVTIDKFVELVDAGTLDSGFAKSLRDSFKRHKKLTDKQEHWALKLADEVVNPKPKPKPLTGYGPIVKLLDRAHKHLKYPKIRLETKDGEPVRLSLAGEKSKYPGSVNVTDGGPFGNNKWYGRIDTGGDFSPTGRCTDEVKKLLKRLAKDPVKVAVTYGKLTGNCCFCGLTLTDERSTNTGYGPVCAKKWGLPWGKS